MKYALLIYAAPGHMAGFGEVLRGVSLAPER